MGVIEILAILILIIWLGGFALNIGGNFIHILLVVALIVFLLRFIKDKV
jgi:hypothetical protein